MMNQGGPPRRLLHDGQVESNREPICAMGDMADTLTSIQSEYQFTMSANGQASGTSTFDVQPVPEPLTTFAFRQGWRDLAGTSAVVSSGR
jgi:hypothetical protein